MTGGARRAPDVPPAADQLPVDLGHAGRELAACLLPRCGFPPPGSPAVCAVSGGADSLAMLVLAVAAGCRATAVHVDHGLRPGSGDEADAVAEAAVRLGAAFEARRVDVGGGPDVEARARAARYAVLPDHVLVAHTADDRAETVVANLLRGAGLDGLAAFGPGPATVVNGRRVVRPIVGLRRHETRQLCSAAGFAPVVDPSNRDPARLRSRVRHRLLPVVAEVAERDPVPVLARQAELLADDAAFLGALAAELDPTDADALARAPTPLSRRAVRGWLRERCGGDDRHPPDAAAVERVLAVARGEAVACEVPGGWRVARSSRRLRLEPPALG